MRLDHEKMPMGVPNIDEQQEELWLISYADMVTLLFGFFVILYSLSSQDENKFNQFGEKMAEAFRAPDLQKAAPIGDDTSPEKRQARALQMLISMLNIGDGVDDATTKIEKAYQESKQQNDAKATEKILTTRLAKERLELTAKVSGETPPTDETVTLIIPGETLFAPGSVHLLPEANAKLKRLASELHVVGNIREIEVQGHTDSTKPGRGSQATDNFTLSSERAGVVAQILIEGGIAPRLLSVRGMADLKPLLPEYDKSGHKLAANMAKNRRVQLLIRKERPHGNP